MPEDTTTASREKGSTYSGVMEIIEAVAKAERPLSPADLSYALNIPKPSMHRLLNQLEADGYLQTSMRGLIMPGNRLHGMAWEYSIAAGLKRCVRPFSPAYRADWRDLRYRHSQWHRHDLLRSRADRLASADTSAGWQPYANLVYRQRQALSQFAAQRAAPNHY